MKTALAETKSQSARELALAMLNQMQQLFICTPPTHNDVTALALMRNAALA